MARLLRRDRPKHLGLCPGCGSSVYDDDQWESYGPNFCHRECLRFVARMSGRRTRLRLEG